ncbi:MAG: hypothetical protein RJA80_1097 [Actinomycetota bacterium]
MSFAAHGNWCGPGWSAKQYKNAEDLTEEDKQVPAVDALDQACKEHDIGIAEGDPEANAKFYEKAAAAGYYGLTLAQFVKIGGPSLQNYLRGGEEVNQAMDRKQKRKQIREKVQAKKRKASQQLDDEEERRRSPISWPEEEKEDPALREMMDAVEENERVMAQLESNDFVTPVRPTPVMAPALTREDRPLRGERKEGSLTNLLNQVDDEMADGDIEMAPMALRSASNEPSNKTGNHETLVKYNSRTEMGIFTETRTAYLPITVYFSINRTEIAQPVPLYFRLDWPYEIFQRNTLVMQGLRLAYNEGTIRAQGLSNDMVKSGVRATGMTGITATSANFNELGATGRDPAINQGQLFPFPVTVVGSNPAVQGTPIVQGRSSYGDIVDAKAVPAYRKWYAKMYDYAHCMETDWKVTYFSGDSNEEFQNIRVYQGRDCQSANNIEVIPNDAELGQIDHWPYMKKHDLITRSESKPCQSYTISGKWTPNDKYPSKMVPNEEDIKTWSRLGTSDFTDRSPLYREDLALFHYSHPDSANQAGFYNVRVDLRYKVQFKDLKMALRYPKNTSSLTLTNSDCVQVPYPTNSTGLDPSNPERVYCDGVIPR